MAWIEGPAHHAIRQFQLHWGMTPDGLVGPHVYNNGVKLHLNNSSLCSFDDCCEIGSNLFLLIFGNGKFGIFVRECLKHPLEYVPNASIVPFKDQSAAEALHLMGEIQIVSETMES